MIEDSETGPASLAAVTETDPTVLRSVDQLRGCGALFERYVAANGADAFVRAAFVYMLGRPVDAGGLATYTALLAGGELSPYGVLTALHGSDEFRAAPRLLCAPTEPGFVFAAP